MYLLLLGMDCEEENLSAALAKSCFKVVEHLECSCLLEQQSGADDKVTAKT